VDRGESEEEEGSEDEGLSSIQAGVVDTAAVASPRQLTTALRHYRSFLLPKSEGALAIASTAGRAHTVAAQVVVQVSSGGLLERVVRDVDHFGGLVER
jgi:hypothetical protein